MSRISRFLKASLISWFFICLWLLAKPIEAQPPYVTATHNLTPIFVQTNTPVDNPISTYVQATQTAQTTLHPNEPAAVEPFIPIFTLPSPMPAPLYWAAVKIRQRGAAYVR